LIARFGLYFVKSKRLYIEFEDYCISARRFPNFFLVFIVHHKSTVKVIRHSRIFLTSQTNYKQPNYPPKQNKKLANPIQRCDCELQFRKYKICKIALWIRSQLRNSTLLYYWVYFSRHFYLFQGSFWFMAFKNIFLNLLGKFL
jgi:Na+/melibiose symporter-like transporter